MTDQAAAGYSAVEGDDRILPLTRLVAWLYFALLTIAAILYFLGGGQGSGLLSRDGLLPQAAALMGAGLVSGAYFFLRLGIGRRPYEVHIGAGIQSSSTYPVLGSTPRWHKVQLGFPPAAVFALGMFLGTLLQWENFNSGSWQFIVWLVLTAASPVLLLVVLLANRSTDPRVPKKGEHIVPKWLRIGTAVGGGLLVIISALSINQALVLSRMWLITPLAISATIFGSWLAMVGVGALSLVRDRRWSAWTVPVQTIVIWIALFLLILI